MESAAGADPLRDNHGWRLPNTAEPAIGAVSAVKAVSPQYVDQVQVNGEESDQLVDIINGVLLRAIGATRAQVRRVVRYESVITSVIGGLLGIAIGLLFGFLMTTALADLGLGFTVPVGQLAGCLVLAVVVGILAAVVPARRGSKVDVLDALHQE